MCFFSRFQRRGPEDPALSCPQTPDPGAECTVAHLEYVAQKAGIKKKPGKKTFSQREIKKLQKAWIQMKKEKLEGMDQAEGMQFKTFAAMRKKEWARERQEKELREYLELKERMKRINEEGGMGN